MTPPAPASSPAPSSILAIPVLSVIAVPDVGFSLPILSAKVKVIRSPVTAIPSLVNVACKFKGEPAETVFDLLPSACENPSKDKINKLESLPPASPADSNAN